MDTTRKYITTEAARFIGVNPATMLRWRKDGVGPAWIRVGERKILYSHAAIEVYLAQCERNTSAHRSTTSDQQQAAGQA